MFYFPVCSSIARALQPSPQFLAGKFSTCKGIQQSLPANKHKAQQHRAWCDWHKRRHKAGTANAEFEQLPQSHTAPAAPTGPPKEEGTCLQCPTSHLTDVEKFSLFSAPSGTIY